MIIPTITDRNGVVVLEGMTLTDPMDIAILKGMSDCTVGGRIGLPSGIKIPPPPPGKVWYVNRGVFTVVDRPKEE